MPPKVLLQTLHDVRPILGINHRRYQRIRVRSRKRRTFIKVILVVTAILPVLTLCLRKKLESFRLFSDLKETCNRRLATLVMGLIPPGLLTTLHILSISPTVIISSSSMQSMPCASVITRAVSAENPIRT